MATRLEVLRMLAELAKLTEIDEGSSQAFRVRAYENAFHGIEGFQGELAGLDKKQLTEIKGVGGSTADKILEFMATGEVAKLTVLREKYPPSFVELTKIPGLGPKTLKLIRAELGVEDLEGLRQAIAAEQLRELPGLGKTSEEKIAKAIERLGLHGKDRRTPLVEALPLARSLAARISALESVEASVPCGSIRRYADTIGDIDIVVATTDPVAVSEFVVGLPEAAQLIGSGGTKTSFLTR
jgi:DNA polymerase (family 10)